MVLDVRGSGSMVQILVLQHIPVADTGQNLVIVLAFFDYFAFRAVALSAQLLKQTFRNAEA